MVGWHHEVSEYELGRLWEIERDRGGLLCRSPWGRKEVDTT